MRDGRLQWGQTSITLLAEMGPGRSTTPPWGLVRVGRMCRFWMLTPSTTTRFSRGRASSTLPVLPLSSPRMTITRSSFFTCILTGFASTLRAISCPPLQHFRSQGHDPHKIPLPQFPGHRPEDARPARVALLVDDDGSVLIKPDRGAVGPPHRLGGAHHHRLHDVALLDHAAGRGLFDRRHDHIADPRVAAAAAAQHANAQQLFGAGVVRHLEPRLLLNHCSRPPLLSPADDLNDAPALLLAQGTRLHDPDHVPGTAQVLLVVGLILLGAAHSALVLRVDHHALDGDHHGFIHLVGDDRSDPGLAHAPLGFRHRQSLLVTPRTPSGGCSAPAPAGWCGYGRYPCAPPAPASG